MDFKLSDYATELANSCSEESTRYSFKIKKLNLDPYTLEDADLDFGIETIPPITYMDIVSYLFLTHSYYSKEQMKAYKSLTAYKYFEAGFVEKVGVKEINGYMLLVGKVQHSMRAREPRLHIWIIAENNGGVCTAHCTCMAGLGEVCSHIAAVLFATEHAATLKNTMSCTELKSTWPVPSKGSLQPIPARLIDWGKKKYPSINIEVTPMNSHDLRSLLQKIEDSGHDAALMRIVEPFSTKINKENDLPLHYSIYDKKYEKVDLQQLIIVGTKIKIDVTVEIKYKVEERTRGQRKSEDWFKQRAGRITASIFKNVCHTTLEKPSISLVKMICYPLDKRFMTEAVNWGIKHEDVAVEAYEKQMKVNHKNFIVNEVGLIISEFWPQLGATPDRIICCDCCKGGCLEVKCPFKARSSEGLQDYVKMKNTCLNVDNNNRVHLDPKHQYYYQVIAQIFICNLQYCDFVVWAPKFLFVERIYPDHNFWNSKLIKALKFHKSVIMPELLGRFYTSKIPGGNITSWCFCGKADDNTMIKCDNEHCSIIYFHSSFVSVPKVLPASWICEQCNVQLHHNY